VINRRKIFIDDPDRNDFLDRLSPVLPESKTPCFAWTLLPNHARLLLRTGTFSIATVMRRLLTGYAVSFNRRQGHLFQNRYKSILCEEDPYLLELVRYIHLNPMRAGIVEELKALDAYSYCRHFVESVLKSAQENFERRHVIRARGYDFEWLLSQVAAICELSAQCRKFGDVFKKLDSAKASLRARLGGRNDVGTKAVIPRLDRGIQRLFY